MNGERWFFDTNVLVYLFDVDYPQKQAIAETVLREHAHIRLSTQVLQEFYVTVTRKLGHPMPPEQALTAVRHFQTYPVAVVSNDLVIKAIRRSIASQLSYWDSLIVETALEEGANVLVTENLHAESKIGSMRVWNPFRA